MQHQVLQAREIGDVQNQFHSLWSAPDAIWDSDTYRDSVRQFIDDCAHRIAFDSLEQPLVENARANNGAGRSA